MAGHVQVLLIGQNEMGFSSLRQWLEKRGCQCAFAPSQSRGAQLLAKIPFDLILCSDRVAGIGALLNWAMRSPVTAYCCHMVEEGYWWLPVIRDGKKCLGESGLRPLEFAHHLEHTVKELESRTCGKAIGATG